MLPTKTTQTSAQWKTYKELEDVFREVEFGETTVDDLKAKGVDLDNAPNVKKLTYLDVAKRFGMIGHAHDGRIKVPEGVLKLVRAGERGYAYDYQASLTTTSREGSFLLDWTNFRRNSRKTGWEFVVLVIVIDGKVEYALSSGNPNINIVERKKNPLGPFQSLEGDDVVSAGIKAID